jgi:hypothetical protein
VLLRGERVGVVHAQPSLDVLLEILREGAVVLEDVREKIRAAESAPLFLRPKHR